MAVIGIDLGTTNSAGAYYDGSQARILSPGASGLVPSVVFFQKPTQKTGGKGEILVGNAALDLVYTDPENAIFSIKRLMGRHFDDEKVEEIKSKVNYTIVRASENEDPGVRILLGEKEHGPVEISTMILKKVKEDAEKALGEKVTHAVITVPAYFNEAQRSATRKAGEQAGLIIRRVIDEPSAAAIAYGVTVSKGERKKLLVFDLGGGTFDVSIILTVMDTTGKNHFEVAKYLGNNWLGGDDFDREIVKEIVASIKNEYDFDPSDDKKFQLHVKALAEKSKITLSDAEGADIVIPYVGKAPDGSVIDVRDRLTRERFEELIQPYVDQCMNLTERALKEAGFEADQIDTVLMVGGSTLVPLVYDTVCDYFGPEKVKRQLNPFHSVALGAGILAATLKGIQCPNEECRHVNDESEEECKKCSRPLATAASVGDISVSDRTSMAFGINAVNDNQPDRFEEIIPSGTLYPMNKPMTRTFVMSADNFIRVPAYEGVEKVVSKNDYLGVIELEDNDFRMAGENAPAGTEVEVSMNYNRNREIHLKIRVKGTSISKEMKMRHNRARPAVPGAQSEEAKWVEELENAVRAAENFLGKYELYMEHKEYVRLDKDIERAKTVIRNGNPREAKDMYMTLVTTVDSCGVASLLLIAEQMQSGASPERTRKIGEGIKEIKRAWSEGDKLTVMELAVVLKAAISAELEARQAQKRVPGQRSFGGLLLKPGA